MKAVAAREGKVFLTELQETRAPAGHVLIRTEYSAISPGTEMTMIKRSGEQPVILGYSAVGIVEQVGDQVHGIAAGQRVACYGAPYVRHAELLTVPSNLVAAVPGHVGPEEAAFAGLGAIAIHALRIADLRFGESVIVAGLGILGHLIAQIASAAACRTIGLDLNGDRAGLLHQQGIPHVFMRQEAMEEELAEITGGLGADCVLLCAGGPGEELINSSFKWIRDRGRIVIVGDLTAEFSRGMMFGKEAQVLISRAGGPGRYDTGYERDNRDYPIGYVRWTEGRNVAEYIRLLAEKRISVQPVISRCISVDRVQEAYEPYTAPSAVMGTLLQWGTGEVRRE